MAAVSRVAQYRKCWVPVAANDVRLVQSLTGHSLGGARTEGWGSWATATPPLLGLCFPDVPTPPLVAHMCQQSHSTSEPHFRVVHGGASFGVISVPHTSPHLVSPPCLPVDK